MDLLVNVIEVIRVIGGITITRVIRVGLPIRDGLVRLASWRFGRSDAVALEVAPTEDAHGELLAGGISAGGIAREGSKEPSLGIEEGKVDRDISVIDSDPVSISLCCRRFWGPRTCTIVSAPFFPTRRGVVRVRDTRLSSFPRHGSRHAGPGMDMKSTGCFDPCAHVHALLRSSRSRTDLAWAVTACDPTLISLCCQGLGG